MYNVNKSEQSETTTSGQSDISTSISSHKSTIDNNEKKNQESFYHWGPLKLWKLSDAETRFRKREGWWSREIHYPDRAH